MGAMADTVREVRDALTAAGISAACEAADVELPGVIIYPDVVAYERLDATTFRMDITLLLVAGQVRALHALAQLDELREQVAAVLPVNELRAVMVQLSSQSPDVLPAFQTTIGLEVTPE